MINRPRIATVFGASALVLAACNNVDMKEYLLAPNKNQDPNPVVSGKPTFATITSLSKSCAVKLQEFAKINGEFSVTGEPVTAAYVNDIRTQVTAIENYRARLPSEFNQNAVVNAVFATAKRARAQAVQQAHQETLAFAASVAANEAKVGISPASPGSGLTSESIVPLQMLARPEVRVRIVEAERKFVEANYPSAPSLSSRDFRNFQSELSEQVLRHTRARSAQEDRLTANATADDEFWRALIAYYSAYFGGTFVDYFGNKYLAPNIETSITDADLANTIAVLFEFIFDEIGNTPVWVKGDNSHYGTAISGVSDKITISEDVISKGWKKDLTITNFVGPSDGTGMAPPGAIPSGSTIKDISWNPKSQITTIQLSKSTTASGQYHLLVTDRSTYYPGGGGSQPTQLNVFKKEPELISLNGQDDGCGMTEKKAQAIRILSNMFASAASNAAGAVVGTVGGLGISLGVFGKISVGDNKAVTVAIQSTVSEIVKRATVDLTYRVLTAVPIQANSSYELTGFFVSPNNGTPSHYGWIPF